MKYTLILLLALVTCTGLAQENARTSLEEVIAAVQSYQSFDSDKYPMGNYSEALFSKQAEFAKTQLERLRQIDRKTLSETEQISLDLLIFKLQDQIDHYTFKRYLNPLMSDSGFHNDWNYIVRPIANYQQAKNYLRQLEAFPDVVAQYLPLLREGLSLGMSQPRVIFKGYENSYNSHIVDDYRESYFYKPFQTLPKNISPQRKDSLLTAAQYAIEKSVIPAYKQVKAFFENEYFPKTRTDISISSIPGGAAYYQNRIAFYTTLPYTADEIHEIGRSEVARIKALMLDILDEVGFEGEFDDFLQFLRTDSQFYASSPEELLMIARDMAKRADAQLPRFFQTLPRKPYGVAPVPDAIAPKYTGGRYIGSPRGSTNPGYYWVNTYNLPSRTLYTLPALTVHEAVPGHHLQASLTQELGDSIPAFRRSMYVNAYGEGWGLYCEYLADEMGMYTTPYERFGQLTYEMWRACRLVVDTGIHAKGWTREQVVDYMASNTALSMHEVNTETDRYISWPGQALAYKIGELKIRELRKEAENALGDAFDIRKFHDVVLEQGTVTLAILERRVKTWIQDQVREKS